MKISPPHKWQPIASCPGYEASHDGNARRVWRNAMGQWCEKQLTPDTDGRGRRRFTLRLHGKSFKVRASRLILETFIGPCPDGMEACHENGKEDDDRLENLRWDTHSNNLIDRRRHGTNVQGEMINTAKLTKEAVREIRRVGYPLRQHAEKHNVSEALISMVLKERIWKHVQ